MKFSILIPTRDRPELIKAALQSALDQDFDDYEVVVSNNGSAKETRDAVRSLEDRRIRYVEPERALSMAEHWEWAVRQLRGDWIVLLADDDVMLPHCLRVLEEKMRAHPDIDVFQFERLGYYYDDGVRSDGNYLRVPAVADRGVEIVESEPLLRELFRTLRFAGPLFPWICARRASLDRIRAKCGAVFHPWAPDVSSAFILLANTTRFCRIRRPLGISGKNMKSFGSGARVSPSRLREFLGQFPEFDGTLPRSPYPDLIVVANDLVDTLYIVKGVLGRGYENLEIDPVIMRQKILRDVDRYIRRGHTEFEAHARRLRRDLARALAKSPSGVSRLVRGEMRRRLRAVFPQRSAENGSATRIVGGPGSDAAFRNIYEAGRYYASTLS